MIEQLGIIEILGIAGSVSLLAGWRLYLTVLATGLAMKFNMLPLPEHLASLQVLANPWVMGAAGTAALLEFFADKIAWFDSIWDTIHTFIRPVGGALLALAVVDPSDPATQVIAFFCSAAGPVCWRTAARPGRERWSTPAPNRSAMSQFRRWKTLPPPGCSIWSIPIQSGPLVQPP